MPHRRKPWIATVHFTSELGNLDVDYGVDHLETLDALIRQGPGYAAVKFIEVIRNPHFSDLPKTIEELARTSESIDLPPLKESPQ